MRALQNVLNAHQWTCTWATAADLAKYGEKDVERDAAVLKRFLSTRLKLQEERRKEQNMAYKLDGKIAAISGALHTFASQRE